MFDKVREVQDKTAAKSRAVALRKTGYELQDEKNKHHFGELVHIS